MQVNLLPSIAVKKEAKGVDELGDRGPTSTSAVIVGLSPESEEPPESDGASLSGMPQMAPIEVPAPPAQIGAALADFETAAAERFPVGSVTAAQPSRAEPVPAPPAEPVLTQLPVQATTKPSRNWAPFIWMSAVAAGLLVAAGIVRAIAAHKGAAESTPTVASGASATAPVTSETAASPWSVLAPDEGAAPTGSAASERRTRAPNVKSAPGTGRPPGQTSGTTSPTRKPCGKALRPCK
jgi:hypothetical protein